MRTRPVDLHKDVVNPLLLSFLFFFAGLALSVGSWSIARNYETQIFPVIRDFQITDPRVVGEHLLFKPSFNKVRDCEFISEAWYVRLADGTLRQVYIGFPNQKPGDQTAPVGAQVRTDTEVGQGEWKDAIEQFGWVYHDCFGYKIRTRLGPFPIYK